MKTPRLTRTPSPAKPRPAPEEATEEFIKRASRRPKLRKNPFRDLPKAIGRV